MSTPNNKSTKTGYLKSVSYLIEATFRGFVGYELLSVVHHNYFTVVAGVYALVTATVIVLCHFVKAHK